ncbi:MAG: ABC transporter permease [Blastocatellia bacterium]
MQTLVQDLRYGARMLLKQPGFTLIAVVTLALGIGANTALFSLLDKLLLQSLPVNDPAALVQLKAENLNPQLTFREFAWADFLAYRARNDVLADLSASRSAKVNLGAGDQLERVRAELVADNYFALFGVKPLLGRTFTPEENRAPGAHSLAVLSYSLWQSRFAGAANVIGQSVLLNEQPYTIIGVVPAYFHGVRIDAPVDVWVPAMMLTQIVQKKPTTEWLSNHEFMIWNLFGRLKPGIRMEAAEPALNALAQQVRDAWMPQTERHLPFGESRLQLEDVTEGLSTLRDEIGFSLLLVFGVVGVVLLIACANLAGLLLSRAAQRRKEIAVRLALGAGRWRLIRQLRTESFLLAGVGGAAGVLFAPWLVSLLLSFQTITEDKVELTLNWRIATFAFSLSLVTGLLFGLLPAWQSSKPDVIPTLKAEGALRADGRGFRWSRHTLIVAQVALSVVVLVSAGLFVRTLQKLLTIDPGYNAKNVLVAAIELPEGKYDEARSVQFFRQLRERLRALPGVAAVAAAENTPLSGNIGLSNVVIEGQPVRPEDLPTVDTNAVSVGYHELMGIALEQGRSFTAEDRKGQLSVVTVNTAFVQKFFPHENPIGRRISLGLKSPWLTIVGVTRTIRAMGLESEDRPQIETPLAQLNGYPSLRLLLRTNTDAASLLPQVRREVRAMDTSLAFFKTSTLAGDLLAHLASQRLAALLTSLFGVVALLLTALGLYGVIAYAVQQRTREIGIRMALGAQARDVLRLLLRKGLVLIGAGLVLGVAGALATGRLIEVFLYGIRSYDPLTYVVVGMLLSLVALLACWLPAKRATRVDPMIALRCE